MRGLIHDAVRWWIGRLIVLLGRALEWRHRRRITTFDRVQAELRRRYAIEADTPIRGFDSVQRQAVEARARAGGGKVVFAATSGTTAEAKQVAYAPSRVRAVKWVYMDTFARAYAALAIQRPSLYVFSALKRDDSLTALLLDEPRLPPYLSTLQAPYRVHAHPEMQALVERYGTTAVRLFVLAISNPGVLYATNPSTLSTFFDRVETDFGSARALIRDFVAAPARFHPIVRAIRRRLDARGAEARLQAIAESSAPLPIAQWLPALEAYVTWDGGDLAPFLRRLETHLDPARYRRVPMYSMSTETVETVSHYHPGGVAFLPLAPGVYYELLAEGAPDEPARLCAPRSAEVGSRYLLVVSDRYGLVRYQTEDLFEVAGLVGGLPDLRFVRRRGLAFSFTGEKLTAEQAALAFARVRAELGLDPNLFLSLIPSAPEDARVPHYELAAVGGDPSVALDTLAVSCDRALSAINGEYASKRETARLGPMVARALSVEAFADLVGGERHRGSWEAQLKFLPLYPRRLEELSRMVPAQSGGISHRSG